VGIENYIKLARDEDFLVSLVNTSILTVVTVPVSFIIGLGLALFLNQNIKGRGVFRTLWFLPYAMTPVITALLWNQLFDGSYGVFNAILHDLGLIQSNIHFLEDPQLALWSIMIVIMWMFTPFFTITLLAGLQGIPPTLFEAAKIDGANTFQVFRWITLPGLRAIAVTVLIVQTIWRFNHFDVVWVLTRGGPGVSSQLINTYSYMEALVFYKMAYGMTISVVSTAIMFVFTCVYIKKVM
jgi:ABC-type sugar transport system permease subunit